MALDQITLFKTALWEEAKGKLRALARMSGQHSSSEKRSPDWKDVSAAVEKFIKNFEKEGFDE